MPMAQKHPKLEMSQEMKHYEALSAPLGITQARGMRHPNPRKLTAAPEMRQVFSPLRSLSDDIWDSFAGFDIIKGLTSVREDHDRSLRRRTKITSVVRVGAGALQYPWLKAAQPET
jgi:hypothetical protein